jgi:prephenate dehydrogenase
MLGRVTVVGCGLIGGSLVKCLREKKAAQRLSAIDREEVLALARPYLDGSAITGSSLAAQLVSESDLIVLATPVGVIVRDLAWMLDTAGPDAVVTDTGSVKKSIVDAAGRHAKGSRFVGGHPMAGREMGGFEAASPHLFEQARWFIVVGAPINAKVEDGAGIRGCDPHAVDRVMELARLVGAEPVVLESEAHDRTMAYVSHAPQLIASALYRAAARAGVLADAGTGFRDVTRIAGGPRAIWRDIFEANRQRIATALGDVLAPLIELRDVLAQEGESGLMAALDLLEEAESARSTMVSRQRPSRESP